MGLRLLYHGSFWEGSTSKQRLQAFARCEGVTAIGHDTGVRMGDSATLWHRVRWKLRWPVDSSEENRRLLEAIGIEQPDVVFVDNSRVISRRTLRAIRDTGIKTLVYYTPDDVVSKHNLSLPLKRTLPEWDVFFTTKTFNVPELRALKVKRPFLVGKAFDPSLHAPLNEEEVGQEFEKFDVVFVGSYERERCASINIVAGAGFTVIVYGAGEGGWRRNHLHPSVELRPSVFARDYSVAWHVGKVALCFLKKINRDRITQRTMEVAAMARPMIAEKTVEHDQHFIDGLEYIGFSNDAQLIQHVDQLIRDKDGRQRLGRAARSRCEASGYSTHDRAQEMLSVIRSG